MGGDVVHDGRARAGEVATREDVVRSGEVRERHAWIVGVAVVGCGVRGAFALLACAAGALGGCRLGAAEGAAAVASGDARAPIRRGLRQFGVLVAGEAGGGRGWFVLDLSCFDRAGVHRQLVRVGEDGLTSSTRRGRIRYC